MFNRTEIVRRPTNRALVTWLLLGATDAIVWSVPIVRAMVDVVGVIVMLLGPSLVLLGPLKPLF